MIYKLYNITGDEIVSGNTIYVGDYMELHIVRCPHCGYEYSASEVIVQNSLLERPYFIKRDENGHVVGALGKEGSLTDVYKCDACDEMFKVDVALSFTLSKVEKFSEISSVSLV